MRTFAIFATAFSLIVLFGCGNPPAPVVQTPNVPTLFVDPAGADGKYKTIAEALEKAEAGNIIKIKPGTYTEALDIKKNVTLEGDGPAKDIIIQADAANVITSASPEVQINGLSIQQTGKPFAAVLVSSGRLIITGCDISATGFGLVSRTSGTEAHVKNCVFHGCKSGGILVIDEGIGIADDNELTECGEAALSVRKRGNSTFRRNKIVNSKKCGMMILEKSSTLAEDNEIRGSAESGVVLINNFHCMARRNKITGSGGDGIFVTSEGKGTFDDNEIRDNKQSGLSVSGAEATILKNKITGNLFGISSLDNAGCKIENNEISGSKVAGVILSDSGKATMKGNTVTKNKENGVLIWKKGKGMLESNIISDNGVDGISVVYDGNVSGGKNTIHDNGGAGVQISRGGTGELKDNVVYDNNDVDSDSRNRPAPPAGKFKPTAKQKGWALACCAVMAQRDGMRHDLLGSDVRTPETVEAHKQRMSKAWGIADKATLLAKLAAIGDAGYRKDFESEAAPLRLVDDAGFQKRVDAEKDPERQKHLTLLRNAAQHYEKKSMLGYDLNNYIALCRWGFLVGYLTETEAWDLIMPKAQLLQKTFESFEEVGENYNIGVQLSIPDKEFQKDTQTAFDEVSKDVASPWHKYIWSEKLD
jgi:parallel beta-helix repeat protein